MRSFILLASFILLVRSVYVLLSLISKEDIKQYEIDLHVSSEKQSTAFSSIVLHYSDIQITQIIDF